MFFTFDQNNSGGNFALNNMVAEYVIIEAPSADRANAIAQHIGIYFDGIYSGHDCACCGDRWHAVHDSDSTTEPRIYGNPPEMYRPLFASPDVVFCHIYYESGLKRSIRTPMRPALPA